MYPFELVAMVYRAGNSSFGGKSAWWISKRSLEVAQAKSSQYNLIQNCGASKGNLLH